MRKRQTELADVDRAAARLHQHTQKYRLDQADVGPRFGLAQHLGEIAGLRLRPTTQAQSLECKEFAQRRDLDRIRILVDAIQRRQLGLLDELRSLDIGRDHAFFNQAMRTIPLRSEEHTSELQSLMRISY